MNWTHIAANPQRFAQQASKKQLEYVIVKANHHYYNGAGKLSDSQYDILIDYLQENFPESSVLKSVGAQTTSRKKVSLPTFLPSMEKIKADTENLQKWCQEYSGPYVLSDKLDGMSLLVHKKDNKLYAYTRGDGHVGQDISWVCEYIQIGSMANGDMVRGECIVSKQNWRQLQSKFPKYSNSRNFVSGYLGSKTVKRALMKYVDFVAYEFITPQPMKSSQQLQMLQAMGWNVVFHERRRRVSNDEMSDLLLQRRDEGDYEVDGIIITSDCRPYEREEEKYPKYAKAFKMILNDQTAEVRVLGITWTPSMYGLLKPVVNVSKVHLDGVNIQNVTGNNAHFILHNTLGGPIGPGALIKLTRSGGVIPKIIEVVEPYKGSRPNRECLPDYRDVGSWRWNTSKVEIVLCAPESNDTVKLKRLEHFFKNLSVPFLKTGILHKLFQHGHKTIPAILQMSKSDLEQVDGIQSRLAGKLYNAIQKKYDNCTLLDIMSGTHVFGSGFGKIILKSIIKNVPDLINVDTGSADVMDTLRAQLLQVKGLQKLTVDKFIKGLPLFQNFYRTLPSREPEDTSVAAAETRAPQIFENRVFAYSGFRPTAALITYIESQGGDLESRMSKKVTELLVKSKDGRETGKVKKAREKNIPITEVHVFYPQFYDKQ